jgi:translocation and assembly module TamB
MLKRRLLVTIATICGLAVLFGLGTGIWVATGGLDRWLAARLTEAAARANVEFEAGTTELDLWDGEARIRGVRARIAGEPAPFLEIAEVVASFEVQSYWSRRVDLGQVRLVEPTLTVSFDQQGRSNLMRLELPESAPDSGISSTATSVSIEKGVLLYADAAHNIEGGLKDLQAQVSPGAAGAEVAARFGIEQIVFDGRRIDSIAVELAALATRDGAEIRRLTVETPLFTANLSGQVTDWKELRYELDANFVVALDVAAQLADPLSELSGRAGLNGRLAGAGASYRFEGALSGNDLLVSEVRLDSLRGEGIASGDVLPATWTGKLAVSRLAGRGLSAANVTFQGMLDASPGADGTLAVERFEGFGVQGSGLEYRGSLGGTTGAGDVALNSLVVHSGRVGSVTARVELANGTIEIPEFRAHVHGGVVTGSAAVGLDDGASRLSAEFRDIGVDEAVAALSSDAPRVSGRASGTAELRWRGLNLYGAEGAVRIFVDGSLPARGGVDESLPLNGDMEVEAADGSLLVRSAQFQSGSSRINATGRVTWNREADLNVSVEAPDGSRLLALVAALSEEGGRQIADTGVEIGSGFRMDGTMRGPLTDPTVSGRLVIDGLRINGEELGRFTGTFAHQIGVLRLENAAIERADGARIGFNLVLPERERAAQVLRCSVDRFPTRLVAAAANLPPAFLELGGAITATIELQRPPAAPAPPKPGLAGLLEPVREARGGLDIAVRDGKVLGEALDEFRLTARLGDERIDIDTLRFTGPRGRIEGRGGFDKVRQSFRLRLEGKDVDLTMFQPVSDDGPPPFTIAGRAGGALLVEAEVGDGAFHTTGVEADVAGQDVVLNGQAVQRPTFRMRTKDDVARVELAADVAGEQRVLDGTIDFRDAEAPLSLGTRLDGADFVNYARLVADVPPELTGQAHGTITIHAYLGDLLAPEGLTARARLDGDFSRVVVTLAVGEGDRSYQLNNGAPVRFNLTREALHVEPTVFGGDGTSVSLQGDLALAAGGVSNLGVKGDINLGLLSGVLRGGYASGSATVQATVAGTLARPRLSGFADVRDAAFSLSGMPLPVQQGHGRILFTSNQALVESFTATSGGGRMEGGGGVLFEGLKPARWRFDLRANSVRLNYPAPVRSLIDGALVLEGNAQLQVLSGLVTVRRAEFTQDVDANDLAAIVSGGQRAKRLTTTTGEGTSRIRLDLRVEARDSLIVRNNVANLVGSASLQLTGPLDDPNVDGRAIVTGGTLLFRNGEYQISRGVVRFPGRVSDDVSFDLQAESEIRGYRVTIGFRGTPEHFYPTFRSEPVLPQTQIVSLIITGDLAPEAGNRQQLALTGIGLAGSLLGEAVSKSVEKRTNRLFGLNRFQIDPLLTGTGDPTARLTVGRRINKNLAVTYSTDISTTNEQLIQFEYRVSDRISVVAAREEDGAYALDVRLKKRF